MDELTSEMLPKKLKMCSKDNVSIEGKETIFKEQDSNTCQWYLLPEPVLIRIFWLLPIRDLLNCGLTCHRWFQISSDEFLWKQKFLRHFKIESNIALRPGAVSWKSEYERLIMRVPYVQSQCLKNHAHQVLHVSFSHNGKMFATCSKDGYVIVWDATHPCMEKCSHNMKKFNWKYTQYSQFNRTDTLLLVSGVHFGSPHSTSGEIAVFTIDLRDDSFLRCRVINRPYDIFGTWLSDQYLISGNLHWLAQMVSTSVLWLNKANQEVDSEHVPIMNQMYKFYNRNASSIRAILIARCPWLNESNDPLQDGKLPSDTNTDNKTTQSDTATTSNTTTISNTAGNPLSHAASLRLALQRLIEDSHSASTSSAALALLNANPRRNESTIQYLDEYRRMYTYDFNNITDESSSNESEDDTNTDIIEDYDELENNIPKYLIFSTGSKTFTPHQIGIKRIRNLTFPKKVDPGPSLKERIAAVKAAQEDNLMRTPEPDWWNFESVADRFDKIDKIIDLHGHIIGMALSPDNRYLYVNTRPWPKDYIITNALEPPPIAQEIDIHVIDLMTLKPVGNMLRAHKAYTPSTECFFIFLDVSDHYVASGAEDMHAYLWDRYYGVSLAKYKHIDVVNSVAFNPKDPEMMVTTSDDYTIKIWRSRYKARELRLDLSCVEKAFDLKPSDFK